MKRFIYNIIKYSFIILLISSIFYLSNYILINKYADFELDKKPKYIILGHSHPECAFNDSVIDNFKNLSKGGESYFYTYFKTLEILKQNKSIETIFVDYSNNQIESYYDNKIWESKYMNLFFPIYGNFMTAEAHQLLIGKSIYNYIVATSISIKKNTQKLIKNDMNYSNNIGGYNYLIRDKTDSLLNEMKNKINIHPDSIQLKSSYSIYNIQYLKKLILLCKANRIRVILIRSPIHPKSGLYHNEAAFLKIYKENFKGVEFMDLSKFSLNNDEYGDLAHLNHKGARKFSVWFNKLLKDGILNKKINQQQIDKFINDQTFN